jgi:hypothetical protein
MHLLVALLLVVQAPPSLRGGQQPRPDNKPLEKSAAYAFVDKEFIFTLEMVKPGVPVFNFVSTSEKEFSLLAKQVRLTFENRKVPGRFFLVDTGNPKEPMIVPSVHMRPKSSFGVRLQGDFGDEKEFWGATVTVGDEDFKLAPMTSFEFENLVLKVNRLNLASPDINDDWRVLQLENLGSRVPAAPSQRSRWGGGPG